MEARREEEDAEFNLVRRGWCLGDETFRQELLAQMRETIGEERALTAEALAEQIITAELTRPDFPAVFQYFSVGKPGRSLGDPLRQLSLCPR